MEYFAGTPLTLEDLNVGDDIEVINEDGFGYRGKIIDISRFRGRAHIAFTDFDIDGSTIGMWATSMSLICSNARISSEWKTYRLNQGPENAKFGPSWGPRRNLPRLLEQIPA